MIPNIIHFVYFTTESYMCRPFSYTNYLAVKTAYEIQRPEKIYMHCNIEPKDNIFWNEAKKYFTIVHREPLQEFGGVKLEYPHYQSDIARLQILLEHGGIYLDNDLLSLKPFNELLNNNCVMGGEGYDDNGEVKSVSNSTILSRPNEQFIQLWLEEIPNALKTGIWAYHAVVTPLQIWKTNNNFFKLENVEKFIPFDFYNPYIFYEGDDYVLQAEEKLKKSYTIHIWETWWAKDHLLKLSKDYFNNSNSYFAKKFKTYSI